MTSPEIEIKMKGLIGVDLQWGKQTGALADSVKKFSFITPDGGLQSAKRKFDAPFQPCSRIEAGKDNPVTREQSIGTSPFDRAKEKAARLVTADTAMLQRW